MARWETPFVSAIEVGPVPFANRRTGVQPSVGLGFVVSLAPRDFWTMATLHRSSLGRLFGSAYIAAFQIADEEEFIRFVPVESPSAPLEFAGLRAKKLGDATVVP